MKMIVMKMIAMDEVANPRRPTSRRRTAYLHAVDDGVIPGRVVLLVCVDGANLSARHELVDDAKVSLLTLLHLLDVWSCCEGYTHIITRASREASDEGAGRAEGGGGGREGKQGRIIA